MSKVRLFILFLLLGGMGCLCAGNQLISQRRAKLIECGWDNPTIQFFHDHIREIEKIPYDGTHLKLERPVRKNGKETVHGWRTVTGTEKWNYEWFAEDLRLLKETKSDIYTDNFLLFGFPSCVPWDDAERWNVFCHNTAIMARLAKEGGLKGFVLDTECYSSPLQFKYYGREAEYEQTKKLARERGRQFMKAIASEYPDMTLFTFLLFTMNGRFINSACPEETLKNSDYSLKVPFLNGMLDELPAQMKIVEGNESAGYTAACREDLLQAYFNAVQVIRNSTYVENQAKLKQVQVGAAIYLDAYFVWRGERNEPYALFQELSPSGKLDAFRRMLGYTLEITDEYAWSWGECGEWWPMPLRKPAMDRITLMYRRDRMWVNSVPGIMEAFVNARKPLESAVKLIQEQKLPNLIRNASFDDVKNDGAPAHWGIWARGKQAVMKTLKESGAGKKDDSAAFAGNTPIATFTQAFRVKPEEQFLISGYFRTDGNAKASIEVGWGCGGRQRVELERILVEPVQKTEDGWIFCRSLFSVPPGRDLVFVHLYVSNAEKGKAYFDKIELHRIDYCPFYRQLLEKTTNMKPDNPAE